MSPVARVECASTQQSLKSWRTSQPAHGAADYRDFNTFVLRHANAQFLHPLISHSHTQLDVLITIISDTNVPKRSSSSSSTSTKRKSPYSRFTHLYDNPSMLVSHLNKYMTIATDLLPFTCFMLLLTVYSSWQTRSQDSSRSFSYLVYRAQLWCGEEYIIYTMGVLRQQVFPLPLLPISAHQSIQKSRNPSFSRVDMDFETRTRDLLCDFLS